ncbi:unnamed protein product [Ceutorhynchus assimilis]|uniref:Uncharacterized protein n=1 Tax=Ceutorhynchus assimilis TaxID=467358 RepID=A0A9N9MFR4_9CUCU|nr:unnamed protein product [Ceutorhynchus assimilis]
MSCVQSFINAHNFLLFFCDFFNILGWFFHTLTGRKGFSFVL